eukprot:Skav202250  [mRNA]  locus=scaffold1417:272960:278692:+ [translate_table: standard]
MTASGPMLHVKSSAARLQQVGPEQMLGNMVLGNLSSLSELSSEGKSGAFFYYTADGKYMLKTVTPKEFALLMQILKGYYDHIKSNPDTLVVRFLGLHCLRVQKRVSRFRPSRQKNLYFVVMANMFNTPVEIHRRYDLKGSWVGRLTASDKRDPHVALKDVDFEKANEKIKLGEDAEIRRFSGEFLANNNIIDYSLLLGIHEKDGKDWRPQLVPRKHGLRRGEDDRVWFRATTICGHSHGSM